MEGKKRFGVLVCADEPEYVKKKYGGYYGVFKRMLGEEGERWDAFRVYDDEFPDDDEIGLYGGFVISGSCSDAHANDGWICKLVHLMVKLDSMKINVLGICFGHQILSRALGGTVCRNTSGWDLGVTSIHLSKQTGSPKMPSFLSIFECHQDEVKDLPPEVEVLGWSEKTGIEMFRYKYHIMGIQGHPEYTKDILLHFIDRLLQHNSITEATANVAKASIDALEADKEGWKKVCTSFLKGRLWT